MQHHRLAEGDQQDGRGLGGEDREAAAADEVRLQDRDHDEQPRKTANGPIVCHRLRGANRRRGRRRLAGAAGARRGSACPT